MENTHTPLKKYAIIGGISLIVVAVVFTSAWYLVKSYREDKNATPMQEEKKAKELSGTLLLSMLPKQVGDGIPLTFAVDLVSLKISPIYQSTMKEDGVYIFHTSLSPDKKHYVTGGIPTSVNPDLAANSVGLYSGVFDIAIRGISNDAKVSNFGKSENSKGKVLRLPSINNAGGILYTTAGEGVNDINFNWEIHYAIDGQDFQVASGLSPHWVSDTSFVYLSSKGIRMHDVISNTDVVVDAITDSEGKVVEMQPNMMMGVSRDGKQIALSNPEEHRVYLFTKGEERYARNRDFSAFGFWPTFSSDGTVLAIQTVGDVEKLQTNPEPRVVFWDIEEAEPKLIPKYIELSDYANDLLFITDWY